MLSVWRFVKLLNVGQHVILLHETVEAKFKVFLNFLHFGFEVGDAAVYVCSESSVEEVIAAVKQFGVDVEGCQKSGALRIVDYTQHYLIDGHFDIDATAKLWKHYYDVAKCKGFKGLRVCSETACFFKHNLVKELVDYERSLHNNTLVPMVAMYAYNADQLLRPNNSVNVYSELVKAHGNVIFSWIDKTLGRIAIS